MRVRLVAACSALLVVQALWLFGAGSKRISAQEPPRAKKHFLEVGKKYQFTTSVSVVMEAKILEEPRDHWVVVDMLLDDKPFRKLRVNLDQVVFIEEK